MKRDIPFWQFSGFALCTFFGTLLHFLYDFSGGTAAAALISGVNESTWEHMKLLYFPTFVFALIESIFFGKCRNFWSVKLRGITLGLLLIPALFYLLRGAFGGTAGFVNIAIFFASAATAFIYEARALSKPAARPKPQIFPFVLLLLIGVLFVVFTFAPPHLPLFCDPLTGAYGR